MTAMSDRAETDARVNAVAALGLPGERADTLEVPDRGWTGFLGAILAERLSGLAVAAVEADRLRLPSARLDELLAGQRNAMLRSLSVERGILAVQEALDGARIPFCVLKGPTLAHTIYPSPSWRPFVDLDLLVRTSDWRGACHALERLGLTRRLPEPRGGFDERFGKGAVFVTASGSEVDLHRTLALGPLGLWMVSEEILDRTVAFSLGGERFRRPDDTDLLLHACVHATLGSWPPGRLPLRDIAQIAWRARVDWDALWVRAERWRLRAIIPFALRTAREVLRVDIPAGTERFLRTVPTRRDRRLLEAYTTRRGAGGMTLSAVRAISGIRSKGAYLWALLVPRREFMAVRSGTGKSSYVRRWLVPAGWFLRGGHGRSARR
jgi:Uncharacterised nucleotidyltransferase